MSEMDGFTYQFAILCPDGELYRQRPSAWCSVLGDPPRGDVVLFASRQAAEMVLGQICETAALMGMNFCGQIVQRLCSPFRIDDPAAHFADAVERWANGQVG
jgi:hypothetical protein